MDAKQVKALVQETITERLDEWETHTYAQDMRECGEWQDSLEAFATEAVQDCADALRDGHSLGHIESIASDFIHRHALAAPAGSTLHRLICRELLKAEQVIASEIARRVQGNFTNGSYHVSAAVPSTPAAPTPVTPAAPTVAPTKLFSEVVALYLVAFKALRPKTLLQHRASCQRFIEAIGGDRPIGEIVKADCRVFKEALRSAKQKASTVNRHQSALHVTFQWALQEGHLPDGHSNPVDGLRIARSIVKKEAQGREHYSHAEIRAVLEHPEFQRQRTGKHPDRYWIVLLCLYHGLRREEAAQLLVSQVEQDTASGVHFFDVREEDDEDAKQAGTAQSIKTAGSWRRVPVHKEFITQLGFLEYVESVKKAGHSRLFWTCRHTLNGYGYGAGRWFSGFIRDTLRFPKSLVFHSTRHSFITGLHAAGASDEFVYALAGHINKGGEVHAGYVHRASYSIKKLRDTVNMWSPGVEAVEEEEEAGN